MKSISFFVLTAVVLLTLVSPATTRAGEILNTYGADGSQNFPIGATGGWVWASGFQTPASTTWELTSATFRIGFTPANFGAPYPNPVLHLYADNGSTDAGTMLDTLVSTGSPAIPSSDHAQYIYGDYVFTPSATVLLTPNTRYWLGWTEVGGSSTEAFLVGSVGPPIAGPATYLGVRFVAGSTLNTESVPWFIVNAEDSGVPEPATFLLIPAALASLAAWRRRTR